MDRALAAFRSAAAYWPSRAGRRRSVAALAPQPPADRSRALSRADVEQLLTREDISLRERTLWRMLYETAARSAEILRLDVEDLDLPNRRARVRRKGGAVDIIVWQTGTARLLPRLLKGRSLGPVFLTDRRARVELPPGDIDQASGRARLSYSRPRRCSSGLRRRDSAPAAALRAHPRRRGRHEHADAHGPLRHTSVRSLARYARVSAEALQRHQAERDPARRR